MAGTSPKGDLDVISRSCNLIKQAIDEDEHHMKFEEEAIYPEFEDDTAMKGMVSERSRKMPTKKYTRCLRVEIESSAGIESLADFTRKAK